MSEASPLESGRDRESGAPSPPAQESSSEKSGKRQLARHAGSVGALTVVSRATGFLRDSIVLHVFGPGMVTDAFNIAFTIPNLFRRLLAEGALSIAFVPIFSEYEARGDQGAQKRCYDATFTVMACVVALVTLLGIVFSPWIVGKFAPGFTRETSELAVFLNRVMFPFLLLVSLTSFFIATLYARRSFLIPGLAPVLLNISQIVCVILLTAVVDPPILGLAIGVLLGGVAQLVVEFYAARLQGYTPRWRFEPAHPDVRRMALLLLPATVGIAIYQFNVLVSRAFASRLAAGSVTYIYQSDRLLELPLGIFAVSVATVSLPELSALASRKEWEPFRATLAFALRLTFFICIPAMIGLMVLCVPIVSVLFQHGAFLSRNTIELAQVTLAGMLGLWAIAGTRNLVPAFYSIKDTRTPVAMALIAFILNALLSWALMGPLGAPGLTLANSISSIVNFALLGLLLGRKIGGWPRREVARSALLSLAASLVMGAAVWPVARAEIWLQPGRHAHKALLLAGAIVFGALLYVVMAYLFKQPELRLAAKKVAGRFAMLTMSRPKA